MNTTIRPWAPPLRVRPRPSDEVLGGIMPLTHEGVVGDIELRVSPASPAPCCRLEVATGARNLRLDGDIGPCPAWDTQPDLCELASRVDLGGGSEPGSDDIVPAIPQLLERPDVCGQPEVQILRIACGLRKKCLMQRGASGAYEDAGEHRVVADLNDESSKDHLPLGFLWLQ